MNPAVGSAAMPFSVELLVPWEVVPPGQAVDLPCVLRMHGGGSTLPSRRTALHLILCIDRSASLLGRAMEQVRKAATAIVNELGDEDLLTLVVFGSAVELLASAVTREDAFRAVEALRDLDARGGTNLHGGLAAALKEARRLADPARSTRLLLVSDGEATVGPRGPSAFETLARGAREAGITLSSLGLGLDYDEVLLASLARLGGGHHYFVEDPSELLVALERELQRSRSLVAEEIVVDLHAPWGGSWERVERLGIEVDGPRLRLSSGSLEAGGRRCHLLRLHLPAASEGASCEVRGELRWRGAAGRILEGVFTRGFQVTDDVGRRERGRHPEVEILWDEVEALEGLRDMVGGVREGRIRTEDLATWVDERTCRLARRKNPALARCFARFHRTLIERGVLEPLLSKRTMVEISEEEGRAWEHAPDGDEGGST